MEAVAAAEQIVEEKDERLPCGSNVEDEIEKEEEEEDEDEDEDVGAETTLL